MDCQRNWILSFALLRKGPWGGFTKKTMVSKSKDFSNLNVEEYRTGFFPSRCYGKGLGEALQRKPWSLRARLFLFYFKANASIAFT
tara:strand:+ start:265 stop:522 length:258 start_codon:yes stop_codon:yes gene_type:complete